MFGKTKDILDSITTGPTIDDFFGDEAATDHSTQLDMLRDRVQQAEQQIHSQFTSMAVEVRDGANRKPAHHADRV
jgi:hypothetical protein